MKKIENSNIVTTILPPRIKYNSLVCKHKLFLDDFEIDSVDKLIKVLNNEYINEIYTENTKIRLKLLLNLSDYLLLTSCYIPTLISPLEE